MNIKSLTVAALAAATIAAGAPVVAQTVGTTNLAKGQQSELDALRVQLAQLQEKLAALEGEIAKSDARQQAQATVNAELQESIDRTADNLARTVGEGASSGWLGRWIWKGDLRVRNETIDQEATVTDRNRNRIRLRAGAFARVNDNTRVEIQFTTTEGGDARSSNQTFTDASSRKALDLDTAYVEWSPNDQWKITAGKMRYPWVRTSSYFFDGDINPEGVAANWQQAANGFFGSVFLTQLAERSTAADSGMVGAQFGW